MNRQSRPSRYSSFDTRFGSFDKTGIMPSRQSRGTERGRTSEKLKAAARRTARHTPRYIMILTHTTHDHDITFIDLLSLALDLLLFGYVAVVGIIYFFNLHNDDECKAARDIPLFLMITGLANIFLSSLRLFFSLTGSILQGSFNFAMVIYGSVLVFSTYPAWDIVMKGDSTYCYKLPFITAVALVIVELVWYCAVVIVLFWVMASVIIEGTRRSRGSTEQVLVIPARHWDMNRSKFRRYTDDNKLNRDVESDNVIL